MDRHCKSLFIIITLFISLGFTTHAWCVELSGWLTLIDQIKQSAVEKQTKAPDKSDTTVAAGTLDPDAEKRVTEFLTFVDTNPSIDELYRHTIQLNINDITHNPAVLNAIITALPPDAARTLYGVRNQTRLLTEQLPTITLPTEGTGTLGHDRETTISIDLTTGDNNDQHTTREVLPELNLQPSPASNQTTAQTAEPPKSENADSEDETLAYEEINLHNESLPSNPRKNRRRCNRLGCGREGCFGGLGHAVPPITTMLPPRGAIAARFDEIATAATAVPDDPSLYYPNIPDPEIITIVIPRSENNTDQPAPAVYTNGPFLVAQNE